MAIRAPDGANKLNKNIFRRFKNGPRPGLTSKAIIGGATSRMEDQAWIPPGRRQMKRMAGCVLRSACRLVMNNHDQPFTHTTM